MASRSPLVCASNCLQNILFRDAFTISRVLTCYQPVRYRKRSSRHPEWFVRRRGKSFDEGLTQENKQFIKDLTVEQYKNKPSPLKEEPLERGEWDLRTRRTGVLALKIGVIPQWRKDGTKIETTLLQIIDNHVIRYSPPEKFAQSAGWKPWWGRKYGSVVVGALSCEPHLFSKEYNNLFTEAGVPPKRKMTRFLVSPNAAIQPGLPLTAMHFRVGDYIDAQAKTIDYGFQGVVKRHGMKGGPASHGGTKWHRRMGGTGGGGDMAGIWKGKKMPGHMGADWNFAKGLRILRINTKYNVLYVTGTTPGGNHCYVRIMDTCLPNRRREIQNHPPMPTFYPEDVKDPIEEEYFDETLFDFKEPSIEYIDEESNK
ncbi:RP-L3 [Mytilus coruscus]|uniref:Large ribosomal subunit protein uL3m n=1 Tax=Mytilus coruscus TaxID=42192 RepID=A0A6J8EIU9_MYTCO|nr:RP-L3 [Mytilus coruscus]